MNPMYTKLLRTLYPLSAPRRIARFWDTVKYFWFPWDKPKR